MRLLTQGWVPAGYREAHLPNKVCVCRGGGVRGGGLCVLVACTTGWVGGVGGGQEVCVWTAGVCLCGGGGGGWMHMGCTVKSHVLVGGDLNSTGTQGWLPAGYREAHLPNKV